LGWRSTRIKNKVDRLSYTSTINENDEDNIAKDTDQVANIFKQTYIDHENTLMIAMQSVTQQDTMYYHQAVNQSDWEQFKKAMNEEINMHLRDKKFSVIERHTSDTNKSILPSVWALRRKRRLKDGTVYKHKARINLDGSKQVKGVHYQESWAPMAHWTTIRIALIMAQVNGWYAVHIDYVQAFTQSPNEMPLKMKIPKGYAVDKNKLGQHTLSPTNSITKHKESNENYCLNLHKTSMVKYKQVRYGISTFPTSYCT